MAAPATEYSVRRILIAITSSGQTPAHRDACANRFTGYEPSFRAAAEAAQGTRSLPEGNIGLSTRGATSVAWPRWLADERHCSQTIHLRSLSTIINKSAAGQPDGNR